jgi:FKBP-type peptidyl-prolyl cis-trans isomerase (trigger factor)
VTKKNTTTSNPSDTSANSVIAPNTTLTISIPWETIQPAYNEALKRLAKKVRSSGFRPGKVPPKIALDIIGEEKVKEEALKNILPAAYQAEVEKSGKQPLTQPEFSAKQVELGSDWEIIAEIAERPKISVKGYEKIAKKAKAEAEKAFEESHKAEPKAESDDKTAKKELTAEEKATQAEKEQAHHDDHLLQGILKALITELKPAIPGLLIKSETRAELEQLIRSLDQFGLSFDDYLARRQVTFEQLSNELASQSLSRLQIEFILEAIVEDQKIEAETSELDAYLQRITDEKVREQQRADAQYMAYITNLVLRQKATKYLLGL